MTTDELYSIEFKPGDTHHSMVQIYVHKIHIMAVVDDNHVVFKWWSKTKRRWIYQVDIDWVLTMRIDMAKEKGRGGGQILKNRAIS